MRFRYQRMKNKFSSVLKILVCLTTIAALWLVLSPCPVPDDRHPLPTAPTASESVAAKAVILPATPANGLAAIPPAANAPTLSASGPADIYEQIRAAQRWFAYAGNDCNGSPRLVASVPAQKFAFIAEQFGVEVKPSRPPKPTPITSSRKPGSPPAVMENSLPGSCCWGCDPSIFRLTAT